MRLKLRLSPSLQIDINGSLETDLEGARLSDCIASGFEQHPELESLLGQVDRINPQILLFHNNSLVHASDMNRSVKTGDVLDLVPAIEGG